MPLVRSGRSRAEEHGTPPKNRETDPRLGDLPDTDVTGMTLDPDGEQGRSSARPRDCNNAYKGQPFNKPLTCEFFLYFIRHIRNLIRGYSASADALVAW
ncbi:MAG: hypothetical protein ACRDRO_15135 [Pseudonocardiaceae bacterium]